MRAYGGSGGIAPLIPDLGTGWRCVVSFTHRPLYSQGNSPWYPLDRRLCGPQSRSGRGGELERWSQRELINGHEKPKMRGGGGGLGANPSA
jgi:hypothetical protein